MKINSLKIANWYILKDFEISFEQNLSILIGENGSGKSSVLELIALIFGHLHKYFVEEDKTAAFIENYTINFITEIKDKSYVVEIKSIGHQKTNEETGTFEHSIKIDGKEYTLREANTLLNSIGGFKELLPKSIVLYYAGITTRLENLNNYFDEKYRKKLTRENNVYTINPLKLPNERPFFYCKPYHVSSVLLCLLISEKESHIKFISDNIEINKNSIEISISLKKPNWAKPGEDNSSFWGASEGAIKEFLTKLTIYSEFSNFEDKNTVQLLFIGIFSLRDLLKSLSIQEEEVFLFKMLDLLIFNDLLDLINISWKNNNGNEVELDRLSEGEKQLLLTSGLSELWSSKNSLFLFDEPDTFLHPNWQMNFIKNIEKRVSHNQYIIATHSPQIINNTVNGELFILEKGYQIKHSGNFYGRDVNSILTYYMKAKNRPLDIHRRLEIIADEIAAKKYSSAKKELDELKSIVSDNDAEYIRLSTKLNFLMG